MTKVLEKKGKSDIDFEQKQANLEYNKDSTQNKCGQFDTLLYEDPSADSTHRPKRKLVDVQN